MASLDIGIDLGTCTIVAGRAGSPPLHEPSVVAVRSKTGEILDIGKNVYRMLGRTHQGIKTIRPIADGVVSDYRMTEALIRHMLQKLCRNQLIKPRVVICVPSVTTPVETQSVIDAAMAAGARQVYLVEEPVAAALGAGLDITKARGNLIVDIGGGTSDIAVLSLGGVVCKQSLRLAGEAFDRAIIRYVRLRHNLLVGEKTAEATKLAIGSVWPDSEDLAFDVKGRNLINGLPTKVQVSRHDLMADLHEVGLQIVAGVQTVLERTPPELAGDVNKEGLMLTGGGALIHGLSELLYDRLGVTARIAENPLECVVAGAIRSFDYLGTEFEGFLHTTSHIR